MTLRNDAALPHAHHVDLMHTLVEDIRRELARMGMMRALVLVRLGASGAYRIDAIPAADLRLGRLLDLGIGAGEALAVIDDVLSCDPQTEAAALVVESNPVDGERVTFLVQDLGVARVPRPTDQG